MSDGGDRVLQVRGLHKRFGRVDVLNGVNLDVHRGQIYGFLGRNGAGKTTTLRALMGVHRPDGGEVSYFGDPPVRRPGRKQKRRIGYVSQEQYFYGWMKCEQLGRFVAGFYPTWDHAEFRRLLDVLDVPRARRVSALSGGMKVKLALALALAHRPALLLLDEPTSGLDPAARREFLDIVQQQARSQGRTTLFSSHIVSEVERIATTVGVLDRGRTRFEGPPARLAAEIRRLVLPPSDVVMTLPSGFVRLTEREAAGARELVAQAAPERWDALELPPGARLEPLGLEDAFLALATARVTEL
jgi:ABC-2 type transport system ATP-binding protein